MKTGGRILAPRLMVRAIMCKQPSRQGRHSDRVTLSIMKSRGLELGGLFGRG